MDKIQEVTAIPTTLRNKMLDKLFKKSETEKAREGKFIVIDGADGSGKKTQTDMLSETLALSGYDGAILDFPQYNTASAAMLEKYLGGEYGNLNAEAASILYSIDRFDASFKLREYLSDGKIILANRYVTSNAGHQGSKIGDYNERIKYYKWLDNLEYNIFEIPKPDLTIILHIPFEVSWELIQERARKDKDRLSDIHESSIDHLKAAERTYLEISELFPNTRLIECVEEGKLLTPGEIHGKVWDMVRRLTLKDFKPQNT
jgi:dTMP kinase